MAQEKENLKPFLDVTSRMEYSIETGQTIKQFGNCSSATNSYMEWNSNLPETFSGVGLKPEKVLHSTPLRRRPAPPQSPNLSTINTSLEWEINEITELLAEMKLNSSS